MSKTSMLTKYWLPVLLVMALIFCASGDPKSFQHSSRIIQPILHWLFPHMPEEVIHAIVVAARKGAHLTEYAILAVLLWRALRHNMDKERRPWLWSQAAQALLLVILFAASDEFHQSFVPTREASVVDVLIDTAGAVLALLSVWVIGRWRRIW